MIYAAEEVRARFARRGLSFDPTVEEIVRGILEKHGASIRMASELGVGTTFWFDLPLEQADAAELQLELERRSAG